MTNKTFLPLRILPNSKSRFVQLGLCGSSPCVYCPQSKLCKLLLRRCHSWHWGLQRVQSAAKLSNGFLGVCEITPSASPLPPSLSIFSGSFGVQVVLYVLKHFFLFIFFFPMPLLLSVWPHNSPHLTDVPLVFRPVISSRPLGSSEAPLFLSAP